MNKDEVTHDECAAFGLYKQCQAREAGMEVLSQVLRDVRIVIADQLGIELEAIPPETKFADIGADSLDTVEIMMALEEKFELTLDEEGACKHAFLQGAEQNDLSKHRIE